MVKLTVIPFWQAASHRPRATWVLPVPLGQRAITFSTPFHPVAARQLQNLHLVELGDRLEVEAVKAFCGREPGCLDAALDHPSFAIAQLQFYQALQELDVVQPLGGALAPPSDTRAGGWAASAS